MFGCCYFKLMKKRMMAPTAIVIFEIAIDSLVVKPQKVIKKGIIRPPPPMPPTLAMPSSTGSTTVPMNSSQWIGKTSLCTQMFFSLQIKKGCLSQSLSKMQDWVELVVGDVFYSSSELLLAASDELVISAFISD